MPHHAKRGFGSVGVDFPLAVHHDANAHALHAARAQRGANLSPQHRAQFKSHQAVQNPTCLLRIHEVGVDGARRLNGLQNGGLGDLREHDPFGLLRLEAEGFHQVPTDGLSFAVLIRREPHGVGFLGEGFEFGHHLLGGRADFVLGGEVVVDVHAVVALGKVADVTHGGFDDKVFAEVSFNGLRLGRRLYDDEVFGHVNERLGGQNKDNLSGLWFVKCAEKVADWGYP